MVIDDKYLGLLGTFIYDKRTKMHGIISDLTIGQFTGLTDKNGNKIFEGDIVKVDGKLYEVKYMLGQFYIGINMPISYKRFDCEVVGNIFDNAELIK